MTRQEIFDKSLNHIKAQGSPGWHPEEGCEYTTRDGKHCAAWPFLSEAAQLNPTVSGDWVRLSDELKQPGLKEHDQFINGLQRIHDTSAEDTYGMKDSAFMEVYLQRMREFAAKCSLQFTE